MVFDPNGHEGSGSLSLVYVIIADFMENYVSVKFRDEDRYELLPLGIR